MTHIKEFAKKAIEPIERTVSAITGSEKHSTSIYTLSTSTTKTTNIESTTNLHVNTRVQDDSIKLTS